MSHGKVGRPSKVGERAAEIFAATARVVAKEGISNTTMSKVADAAGLQRTLVLHYFGDRKTLMSQFITTAVAEYGERMLPEEVSDTAQSPGSFVAAMFASDVYRSTEDLIVWIELVALSAREERVRTQLQSLWESRWLPAIERRLAIAYPDATADAVSAASYGLACLFEAHWAFHAQGVGGAQRAWQATVCARLILSGLESPSSP